MGCDVSSVSVGLCSGKDCRKRAEYRDLRDALGAVAEVRSVKCLDVCDGPVIVVQHDGGEPVVLRKVRTDRDQSELLAWVRVGERPGRRLSKRIVGGKRRRKALARLARN